MAGERRQDLWYVHRVYKSKGEVVFDHKGLLDLQRPMTAFEAADYGVRFEVREVLRTSSYRIQHGHQVLVEVYGRHENRSNQGRERLCTAVAEYDEHSDIFKRLEPWRGDGCWTEVGTTEGARIEPLDWQ